MERKPLLGTLKRVGEALASRDLIPVLACLCFDGRTCTAYDDVVALRAPCPFPVTGGVRGKLLLDFLTAARSNDLEVTSEGESVRFKAGRSKLDMPCLPASEFLFKAPRTEGTEISVTPELLSALKLSAISLGQNAAQPWMLGVTMAANATALTLYSSDNKTATRVSLPGAYPDVVTLLPPRFVSLILSLSREESPETIHLASDWALAVFPSGLRLFSRTIGGADAKTFKKLFSAADRTDAYPIPKGLEAALARAAVVLPHSREPFTRFAVSGGKLSLVTRSDAGNVADKVPFADHPDITATAAPDNLARALAHGEEFGIAAEYLLLRAPGFLHLVTTVLSGDSSANEAPAPEEE